MKKIAMNLGIMAIVALPLVAFAQNPPSGPTFTYFNTVVSQLKDFFKVAMPLVFAAAVLGFLVGVGMYLFSAGNDKMKDKAKSVMLWGILFLVGMFSVYGIIQVVASVLGVGGVDTLSSPRLPGI